MHFPPLQEDRQHRAFTVRAASILIVVSGMEESVKKYPILVNDIHPTFKLTDCRLDVQLYTAHLGAQKLEFGLISEYVAASRRYGKTDQL